MSAELRAATQAAPIALFYFAFIGALGLFLPYFPLFLGELGLPPSEVTRAVALGPMMSLVAPALFGLAADLVHARVWLLRGLAAAAALSFACFAFARSLPAIYLVTAAFACFRAPMWALTDTAALEHVRRNGGSYGRVRLWGSIGFLGAAAAGGAIVERWGAGAAMMACGGILALATGCAWALPAPPPARRGGALPAYRRLVGDRTLWPFFGAVALAQAAGAAYDSCYSLHLRALGVPGDSMGLLWATGVLSEVLLLAVSGRLLARVPASRLLVIALIGASARWALLGAASSTGALFALAPLHAVSFGLYYVAGVTIVQARAAPEIATAAQGLFAGVSAAGSLLGMTAAGVLFERSGGHATFAVASAVAALAAVAALLHARLSRPRQEL
jgi:PPP family 3-phenylpropionic acid transporter